MSVDDAKAEKRPASSVQEPKYGMSLAVLAAIVSYLGTTLAVWGSRWDVETAVTAIDSWVDNAWLVGSVGLAFIIYGGGFLRMVKDSTLDKAITLVERALLNLAISKIYIPFGISVGIGAFLMTVSGVACYMNAWEVREVIVGGVMGVGLMTMGGGTLWTLYRAHVALIEAADELASRLVACRAFGMALLALGLACLLSLFA